MTWAQRLYQAVVDLLPYVVLVFGLFSTALGVYALAFVPAASWVDAGLPVAFGLFLTWSGWGVVRKQRRDDPGGGS